MIGFGVGPGAEFLRQSTVVGHGPVAVSKACLAHQASHVISGRF